jgi:SH3-like domain-containing protein
MNMRKHFRAAMLGAWLLLATAASAEWMSVQVQSTQVREMPSYLGRVLATANYTERVEVLQRQRGWAQVRVGGRIGWVNESALTKKQLRLVSGAADVERSASGEEIALAGKGFNSQVEADFKAKNSAVDFTWIDRMEKFTVSEQEIGDFLREGGLK